MKKMIQKILVCSLSMMGAGLLSAAQVFTVASPVVQNMVAGSSQNLSYTLANKGSGTVNVHCSFTSDNPNVTFNFNGSGCTSSGGVGLPASPNTLPVLLTLNSSGSVSGTIHGTLTFQQTNGRGQLPPPQTFSVKIETQSNSDRRIVFVNYCPFNVYLGMASGNAPAANKGATPAPACTTDSDCASYTFSNCVGGYCGGGACNSDNDCMQNDGSGTYTGTCKQPVAGKPSACSTCYVDADCIAGSSCNLSSHLCYWNTPMPSNHNYQLTAHTPGQSPATNSVNIADNSATNGYTLVWTGRAAGRTGCSVGSTLNGTSGYYSCQTADCNDGGSSVGDGWGGCGLAQSFASPSTLLEFALVALTPDTYDVSVVNGLNIPVTMQPFAPQIALNPITNSLASPQAYGNPFTCGNAGSTTQTNTSGGNLGACSWSFTSNAAYPGSAFRFIEDDSSTSCTTDADCLTINSHWRCGQTFTNAASGTLIKTCGYPLGYWNQNELCVASDGNYAMSSVVDCSAPAGGNNTVYDLLQGTNNAAASCYNVGSLTNTCTGCTNWQNQGIIMPTSNSIVQQCQYPNSNWGSGNYPSEEGAVLPGIVWLKQGCPSAYSYVYDDKSSTFGCPANNGQSGIDYLITFCPDGNTAGSTAGVNG